MCVIWTQKYHICGCIWTVRDLYCRPDELCWGARMVIIHSHLQTCKECWKSGDKRVNDDIVKFLAQHAETERRRIEQLDELIAKEESEDVEAEQVYQDKNDRNPDLDAGEEDFAANHPSRPITPDLNLDPEQMPRWLFAAESLGDATRSCDPVKPGSIWKDYRARRGKTDWYMLEDMLGVWLGPTESSSEDRRNEDDDF
ncbi:uncharacterized protein N7482_010412 [Penicillium canariense]|uniref:Uncharacterized protein n=1 Tax=Penicillium canariense TaxID=189055 RepID=A0A9W9LEH1_9EURO|nr:uncharacterized protein N7482_010412 [Penicillium canariense]KAJ5151160.1 hypothetical protein N7482_010412 [Penicillium canariense]